MASKITQKIALLLAASSFSSPANASSSLLDSANELSTSIVRKALPDGNGTIAVSTITHSDNTCSELSNFFSEQLVDSLFDASAGNFSIIERSQLNAIFKELNLVYDGTVAPDTAKKIGEIEGVNALVTGKITEFGDQIVVQGRLISTENGKVFSTARSSFPKTDTIASMMSKRSRNNCGFSQTLTKNPQAYASNDREANETASATNDEITINSDFMNRQTGVWVGTLRCEGRAWSTKFVTKSVQGFTLQGVFSFTGSSKDSKNATLSFTPKAVKNGIPIQLVTDGQNTFNYSGHFSNTGFMDLKPSHSRCDNMILSKT